MTPDRCESIGDEELDRLLEVALSVTPSPSFRARVGARIAEEPPLRIDRRWLLWPSMAAAAASALAIAAIVLPGSDGVPGVRRPVLAGIRAWHVSANAAPIEDAHPFVSSASPERRGITIRFDRREREAFAGLLARPVSGELDPAEGVATEAVVETAVEAIVLPLEIRPLEVRPIDLGENLEGDPRQ
jgi:hypothetical protein